MRTNEEIKELIKTMDHLIGNEYAYNKDSIDTLEDIVITQIFGFCGCGLPEYTYKFIFNGLKHIKKLGDCGCNYKLWEQEGKEIFHTSGIKYFFYYVLDNIGLTEHGSSVPGWLTVEGEILLDIMIKNENETK